MSKPGSDLEQNQFNFRSYNSKMTPITVSNSDSSKFNHIKSKSHNYNNNSTKQKGNFADTSTKFPSLEIARSNIRSGNKVNEIKNQPSNLASNLINNLNKSPPKIHYHKGIPKMKNSSNNLKSNTVFQPLNNVFPKDENFQYVLSRNEEKNDINSSLKMEKTFHSKINILKSTMKIIDKDIESKYNKFPISNFNNNTNLYSTSNSNFNKEQANFSNRKFNTINVKNSTNVSKDFNNTISNNNSDKNINNNNFYVNSVQKQSKNTFRKGSYNNSQQVTDQRYNFNQTTQKQIILKDPSQLNLGQNKVSNVIREDLLTSSPFIKGYGSMRADDNLYKSISDLKLIDDEINLVNENKKLSIKKSSCSPTKDFPKSFNSLNVSLPLNKDEQKTLNLRTTDKVKKNNQKSKSTNYNEINSNSNTITENKCINQTLKAVSSINCISYKSLPGKINSFQSKMNQDSFLIMTNVLGLAGFCILGVFDGHGTFGHLVSDYVKKFFDNYFRNFENYTSSKTQLILTSEDVYKKIVDNNYNLLSNAFTSCENNLSKEVDFDTRLSGTTSILVICIGEYLICANAGDSRAMMSSKTGIKNLSYDHKPEKLEEKSRIIKAGGKVHPTKEFGKFIGPCRVWVSSGEYPGLAMSRSIGDFMAKSVGCTCSPGKLYNSFINKIYLHRNY